MKKQEGGRPAPNAVDSILRTAEVCRITSLERTTVMRLVQRGKFPPPMKIGLRAVGWRASHIQKWMNELQAAE